MVPIVKPGVTSCSSDDPSSDVSSVVLSSDPLGDASVDSLVGASVVTFVGCTVDSSVGCAVNDDDGFEWEELELVPEVCPGHVHVLSLSLSISIEFKSWSLRIPLIVQHTPSTDGARTV